MADSKGQRNAPPALRRSEEAALMLSDASCSDRSCSTCQGTPISPGKHLKRDPAKANASGYAFAWFPDAPRLFFKPGPLSELNLPIGRLLPCDPKPPAAWRGEAPFRLEAELCRALLRLADGTEGTEGAHRQTCNRTSVPGSLAIGARDAGNEKWNDPREGKKHKKVTVFGNPRFIPSFCKFDS